MEASSRRTLRRAPRSRVELEPIEPTGEETPTGGEDLLRADNEDPDGIFDPNAAMAVWDAFGESSGGD